MSRYYHGSQRGLIIAYNISPRYWILFVSIPTTRGYDFPLSFGGIEAGSLTVIEVPPRLTP